MQKFGIIFIFASVFVNALCKCSDSQINVMNACLTDFGNTFNFDNNHFFKLVQTWKGLKNMCNNYNQLEECLKKSNTHSCLVSDNFDEESLNYFVISYTPLYYNCRLTDQKDFKCYKEALHECSIDNQDCLLLSEGFLECSTSIVEKCGHQAMFYFLYIVQSEICYVRQTYCSTCVTLTNMIREDLLNVSSKYLNLIEYGKQDVSTGAKSIRRFLQTYGLDSVNEDLQEKIASSLSEFLRESDREEIQIEVVYAISIFANNSLERSQIVIDTGVVPDLIEIMYTSDNDLLKWATLMSFASLMKGNPNQRDYCIKQGLLPILIELGFETSNSAVRNGVAVTMYCLCQDKPNIPIDIIAQLLPSLKEFLKYDDDPLIDNTLSTLAFITKKGNDHVQFLIEYEMTEDLIKFLDHGSSRIQFWAFGCLESMAEGTDEQFKHLINTNILSRVKPLLMFRIDGNILLGKKVLPFLLGIIQRDKSMIQSFIDEGLIEAVIDKYEDVNAQQDAAILLSSITQNTTPKQLTYLLHQTEIIMKICKQFKNQLLMTEEAWELVAEILETSEKESFAQQLDKCGAMNFLDNFKGHDEHYIRKLAYKIKKLITSTRTVRHNDL